MHPRLLLDALGKCFLPSLSLLLRRRLVARDAVVNVAFLGLAKVEDAASTLAFNENGGFRVGALPFPLPSRPSRACLRMRQGEGPAFSRSPSPRRSCPILSPGVRCPLGNKFALRGVGSKG
jgi:hypothetical protein